MGPKAFYVSLAIILIPWLFIAFCVAVYKPPEPEMAWFTRIQIECKRQFGMGGPSSRAVDDCIGKLMERRNNEQYRAKMDSAYQRSR